MWTKQQSGVERWVIDNHRGADFISNEYIVALRAESKLDVQAAYSMAIEWTNRKADDGHVDTECDASSWS